MTSGARNIQNDGGSAPFSLRAELELFEVYRQLGLAAARASAILSFHSFRRILFEFGL